jgi:KDO2-lipid IV(A) lauroyltransferase
VVLLLPLVRLLPWEAGRALGRLLGSLGYRIARKERALALEHLERSLGDRLSENERIQVCRGMFRHIGQVAAEALLLPKMVGPPLLDLVDGEAMAEQVRTLLARKKGLIVITGHLGNWELSGSWVGHQCTLNVVARRVYYEPFNALVVRNRSRLRMRTLYRDDSPRELLRCLRRGEAVAILSDQDVSDAPGVYVDFFGRPAYTVTGPVSLALVSGAPVLLAVIVREGKRFRAESQPLELVRTGDKREDIETNTARWSRWMEERISDYPDQWPWYHRRWYTTEEVLARRRRRREARLRRGR